VADASNLRTLRLEIARRSWLKYALDRLLAAGCLPIILPVCLVVWLAMALEGLVDNSARGPLLYREERWTQGEPFCLLKFRSTYPGSQVPGEVGRVTRVGYWLKRYYLDELPQIVNILRGEMSWVGPRPNVPWKAQLEIEQEGMLSKAVLRAGLTGLVQVHKADAHDRQVYQRLEMAYLEKVRGSSALQIVINDLRLLLQTLPFMLKGEGL
jgi:lipopolysaccharide/colanic/teichoic acid biosynthesis glycosyltransferase